MDRWRALALVGAVFSCASAERSLAQSTASDRVLNGTVVDSAGRPVAFAHVAQRGSARYAVTNANGVFRLALDPATREVVVIRRIGFSPAEVQAPTTPDSAALRVVVASAPSTLPTVRIEGRGDAYDQYLDRQGYYRRMGKATTSGTFLSRDLIERRNPTELTQLLRDVPGVQVVARGGRAGKGNVPVGRGTCALGLVVDGRRVEYHAPPRESLQPRIRSIVSGSPAPALDESPTRVAESFDELVDPQQLAAAEVYPTAVSVPAEFQHLARSCGLVVVWTSFK